MKVPSIEDLMKSAEVDILEKKSRLSRLVPYQPKEFEIASVIGIWHDEEIGEPTIYNKENFVEINEWREIRLNELGIK